MVNKKKARLERAKKTAAAGFSQQGGEWIPKSQLLEKEKAVVSAQVVPADQLQEKALISNSQLPGESSKLPGPPSLCLIVLRLLIKGKGFYRIRVQKLKKILLTLIPMIQKKRVN